MTDKLAEAIEMVSAYFEGKNPTYVFSNADIAVRELLIAARKYRNIRNILHESQENFERQFGWDSSAKWVYDDLRDMFGVNLRKPFELT